MKIFIFLIIIGSSVSGLVGLNWNYLKQLFSSSRIPSSNTLPNIGGNVSSLIGINISTLSLDGIRQINPVALSQFLTEQINYFKNKILYVLDDFGNPTRLHLEIPDLNFFYRRPDLNKTVTFSLFDKRDGNKSFDTLKIDDENLLKKSRFDANRPTVFITHGFLTSAKGPSVTLVRDAYLKKRDYNVITVNWSPHSIGSYTIARLMVSQVGNHVGKLINFLYKHGMNPNTTVLIGHSLGSHVMGFAGQTASDKVNHIIGLDPAWPLFIGLPIGHRISDDDAYYVEIIHTNGGMLGTPGLTGDYDFYPNGGYVQNGCEGEWSTACSHGRAYAYLAEQIEEEGSNFAAVECDSYTNFVEGNCARNKSKTIMGAVDKNRASKGSYYLDTNTHKPFGLGARFFNPSNKKINFSVDEEESHN